MTTHPNANPTPPDQPAVPKPKRIGSTLHGFIASPFIFGLLFVLNDIAASNHSQWVRFLLIVFLIAVFAGLLFRQTRRLSIGVLLFIGTGALLFFGFWALTHLWPQVR